MFRGTGKILMTVAVASSLAACSATEFSSEKAQGKADSVSMANPDLPGLDDVGRDLPSPPAPGNNGGICNFPVYNGPYNSPSGSECHSTSYTYARASGPSVASGRAVRFRMYNASNLSHGLVPSTHRSIATQKISLAPGLAAGSVDLVLSSYEPVIWKIIGNAAAVRSVHVDGYHCAKVEGVAADKVRIQTYEQGLIESANPLPLSSNLSQELSVYEGSCLADNTLFIQ